MRRRVGPASATHFLSKPQASRRERHRAEMRERIFRAALELFAQRGYLETTVEDITEAADVGKGTFFNYFPTKEHVLARYGEERIQEIERALERARSGQETILAVLKDLATDLAGQSSESPDLLRSVFAANLSCAPVRAELQKRIQRARELLGEIFALGQHRGEIRRDLSAPELARLIRLMFMGVTIAWAINPDAPLRGTAEQVWELLCPSLRPGSTQDTENRPESEIKSKSIRRHQGKDES
ncbi:MAG TPA: TetR family transcriptional regulator [Candidatus Acidoferrum sp.]|nr:TetR family transcriptional regulator [Candidatus Acidoferrum sp.]